MDINEEVSQRLAQLGPEKLLHDGIKSLIDGCIAASLMNFGMMPTSDPFLSIAYGNGAIERALDEIKRTYKHIHHWQ